MYGTLTLHRTHNFCTGHYEDQSGVAYHGEWITPIKDIHGHNWVISTHRINEYRSNGIYRSPLGKVCSKKEDCTPSQLSINKNINVGEQLSNWMVAEALIYDTELSFGKIEEIEAWLNFKYRVTDDIG